MVTTYRGFDPKKTMVSRYRSTFLVHFTMLAPNYNDDNVMRVMIDSKSFGGLL